MRAVDVAIVGAGPGGAAAALSIRKTAPHLNVRLYERAQDTNRAGAVIGILSNGRASLEAIGADCLARVDNLILPDGPSVFHSSKGQEVRRVQSAKSAFNGGLVGWYQLQQALLGLLPPDTLHLGCSLHSLTPVNGTDAGVDLRFTDQDEPVRAKVVIGCDGNLSKVRSLVLADGPPTYNGMGVWRGIATAPADWPHSDHLSSWFGDSVKTGVVSCTALAGGLLSWQTFVPWPADRLAELGDGRYIGGSTGRGTVEDRRQRCLSVPLLTDPDFPAYVLGLIHSTDPHTITEHGVFYREPEACQVWGKGPVTLLGDAAHLMNPTLAQGLNFALEDAVELGRAIGEHGPTEAALREYERVRVPRATAMQAAACDLMKQAAAGKPTNGTQWHADNPWCIGYRPEPLVTPQPVAQR